MSTEKKRNKPSSNYSNQLINKRACNEPKLPGFIANNKSADILSRIPFKGTPSKCTVSVALPSSIISNAQSLELKAYLVGQIARILAIFGIDEIVVYEDKYKNIVDNSERQSDYIGFNCSRSMEFFVKNLRYLETPQYLRKSLFKFEADLKFAGLQNPIDAPHHMRISEWLPYRQGVVVSKPRLFKGLIKSEHKKSGSWVNCGLPVEAWIDESLPDNTRITIKMIDNSENLHKKLCDEFSQKGKNEDSKTYFIGKVVSDETPRTKKGIYWGYKVRPANSLKSVLFNSPYKKGYDLVIGTSERGCCITDNFKLEKSPDKKSFKHLLIVFGGLGGLEDVLGDPQSLFNSDTKPEDLFDMYVNICPEQKSRTIRTEEALGLTLVLLRPYILENNKILLNKD
ncbi:uncharacterized protein CMU_014750 [Cryptosporidium muris RN66]|uniref:Uncharacterized protein n=1 Tax=Cryptosporidium muris (strain RN66) TaxID=441375 RepID=B6AF32_CRYMR|nr:uncharacterized protein CMU_014750 [Cryptosporidium muris RN66]EEA06799.1 hypothetical protein, conserved [Cryptosporidium muris RN66]|eukprot:XP_002141148.1 hypothetical protein [Cryptosporidium muris RN66]